MKCLSLPTHELPTMQQVLSEVRLLAVLARQYDSRRHLAPPAAPAPVIVQPLPPPPPPAHPVNPRAAVLARLAESSPPLPPPAVEPPAADETGATDLGLTSFGQPAPKKPPEPAPARTGPCPRCDGSAIFVSKPRSAFERVLAGRGVPICRCHRCYHRWIVFARLKIGKSMPTDGGQRKKVKQRKK